MSYDRSEVIAEVDDLAVTFEASKTGLFGSKQHIHAVDGVSFQIRRGETLGLVGESGSGKSTTGRAMLRRVPIARGRVSFRGEDITHASGEHLRKLRRHMQLVYQDPYTSLNPRMRVREIIAEPLVVHGVASGRQADARVDELLALTGLPTSAADRYPHAFSGGQRQRIGIARALALGPELIIADEPVSALDVSIQAQVINLLEDIQRTLGVAYLFIGHDLSVVRHISDRIAIMYCGQIVEMSDSDAIFDSTLHPYTESLLSALPIADPEVAATKKRIILSGEVPSPISPPPGCRFFSRCPYAQPERCELEQPVLREAEPGHLVACHYAEEIRVGTITRRAQRPGDELAHASRTEAPA